MSDDRRIYFATYGKRFTYRGITVVQGRQPNEVIVGASTPFYVDREERAAIEDDTFRNQVAHYIDQMLAGIPMGTHDPDGPGKRETVAQ